MRMRYIDGLQVAVVQRNPIRESLGLSHRRHGVHQYRVVLAEDQRRRGRIKAERLAEGPWPLADHSLSRGGKNVHTKRVRRDRRGHARGLFQSICAVHLVLLSMSERVTVQGKIGRSATTNPLDERIDPYQSIGWTLRSGTGIIISQRALPGGDARLLPFKGASVLDFRSANCRQQSVWSDRRRCADRGLGCEFRRTHNSEPQAEGSRS